MNFIKKITICLLTLGMVSCSSCAKKDQLPPETPAVTPTPSVTVAPPPVVVAVPVVVSNVEFTLPSSAWQAVENTPANVWAFKNATNENLVLLIKETFNGTFEEYVLASIRETRDVGAKIESTKQVTINGTKFVLIESSMNHKNVMMWVTWANGFGYTFGCSSPDSATDRKELCNGIANTFKLK